jgi:Phospholipase_D-nuclease N-terminal
LAACLSTGSVSSNGRSKAHRNLPLGTWRQRYRTYSLEEAAMYGHGLWALLVLIADVWAIVNVFQSAADTGKKVLWVVLVLVLPLLGVILWYFLGPRTGKT